MRLFLAISACAALIAATAQLRPANGQDRNDDHRRSMGNLRPNDRTAGPAIQGSPPPRSSRSHYRSQDRDYVPYNSYPYYGGPHYKRYYQPYYGAVPYYDPYPSYYYRSHGYIPPTFATPYGYHTAVPSPLLGIQVNTPQPNTQIIVLPKGEAEEEAEEPARRATNRQALDLGWRFIGFGDAQFGNQKYAEAYSRYKKAAQAAPALADAQFRQGYALMALGSYDQAAKALRRGLAMDPEWPQSHFRSEELYGIDLQTRAEHLNAMTKAAAAQPNDADLLFVMGVFLYFDGQQDRAAPLLERALRLEADGTHVTGFLRQLDEAIEEPQLFRDR